MRKLKLSALALGAALALGVGAVGVLGAKEALGVSASSEATMTAGDNASAATVNTKSAIKCGTGKKAGSMKITLSTAGATELNVYVAGWNNDTGRTINVSVTSGVTISPTSFDVANESGIAGSGSAFTVADESTHLKTFTLSNAVENTEITFTAAVQSNNRFVVWGATYETGGDVPPVVETYSVFFDENGENVTGMPETLTEKTGVVSLASVAEPSREGYDFLGWSLTSTGEIVTSVTVTDADVTVYAIWKVTEPEGETMILTADSLGITEHTEEAEFAQGGVSFKAAPGGSSNKVKATNLNTSATKQFADQKPILMGKNGAYLYNSTELAKPIKSFSVYTNLGASTSVIVGVEFGVSALTSSIGNTNSKTLSQLDAVYSYEYEDMSAGYTFFRLQVLSTHNAQVQIKIEFDDEVSPTTNIQLTAENIEMELGDADVTPVVKANDVAIAGCSFASTNTSVATVVGGKIHAAGYGVATITASHEADEEHNIKYLNASFTVTVKGYGIQDLYSFSAGTAVEFDGYYAGEYADGVVVMDGSYGMLLYKVGSEDEWVIDETVLHVSGSLTIYHQLFEISAGSTVSVQTSAEAIAKLAKPVNYTITGSESVDHREVANRRTFLTGKLDSITAAGSNFNVVISIGKTTYNFFLKAADNVSITLKDSTVTTISDYLTGMVEKTVTVKGFTSFFDAFQIRLCGIVEPDESYTIETFAQQLLDETDEICEGYDGEADNKEALTPVWNHLGGEERWQALSPEEQAKFQSLDYTPDYEGTSESVIERALGRYNYLCKKYFADNNFANRSDVDEAPTQLNAYLGQQNTAETTSVMIVVVAAVALVSIASVVTVVVIKRRRMSR